MNLKLIVFYFSKNNKANYLDSKPRFNLRIVEKKENSEELTIPVMGSDISTYSTIATFLEAKNRIYFFNHY